MHRINDEHSVQGPVREPTRRLVLSVTWALVAAFVVGAPAAYLLSTELGGVSYTAEGVLWMGGGSPIEIENVDQMRDGWPGWSDDCIAALCAPHVLVPVILDKGLYLRVPEAHADAFSSFSVTPEFVPGTYRLRVDDTGDQFALIDTNGLNDLLVQTGTFESSVGKRLGFVWSPSRDAFAPGAAVEFSVLSPKAAGQELSARLVTEVAGPGRVVRVSLTGPDPGKAADVLNAIMDRYVEFTNLPGRFEVGPADVDPVVAELLEIRERMKQASRAEMRVMCGFAIRRENPPVIQLSPGRELRQDEVRRETEFEPAARVFDAAAVPTRPDEGKRLPIAVLTFLGCFGLALRGALRLSRTAFMDGEDIGRD